MTQTIIIVGALDSVTVALESSYARAFSQLGYSINRWNPVQALYEVARLGKAGQLLSRFVHVEPWIHKANLQLLLLADRLQPQLILIIGTTGVHPGTLAQIHVRLPKCLCYCIYPDSPYQLESDRILCLPFFQRVTTSSPAWVDAFQKLGAHRVHYLPFAADPALHVPIAKSNSASYSKHDLAFVGSWRPERELIFEQLIDFDLIIWGSDYWKKRIRPDSPLREHWAGKSLSGEEFAQVCASSSIMLNVMDAATWPGPNMRTFEQSACRAFSLTTRSEAVLDLFREGETIECFDSVEEARSKIQYYLEHDDARETIANASYHFVIDGGHTYIDRVKQLITWMREDAASFHENVYF